MYGRAGALSPNFQQPVDWVGGEIRNGGSVAAQGVFDFLRCAIAEFEPEDFGREASQDAQVSEVGVFGNNDEAVGASVFPDHRIVNLIQPNLINMRGSGIKVAQPFDQFGES